MALVCGLVCLGVSLILGRQPKRVRKRENGGRALLTFGMALLSAAVFCNLFYMRFSRETVPVRSLSGKEALIEGTFLDVPENSYGRYFYTVRVNSVKISEGTADLDDFRLRLMSWQPIEAEPYDGFEAEVKFYAFDDTGGLYSTANSRLADGMVLGAYLSGEDIKIIPNSAASPGKFIVAARTALGRVFDKFLPRREAGLIRAVLLGDRTTLSDEIYQDFQSIGASHLLVVSGLHISALMAVLRLAFSRIPIPKALRNALNALALLGFLAIIGFPPSAVRSGVMFLVFLLGDSIGREPDSVNSLGFAVFLICLLNPYSGGDLGLALSVMTTLGILLFSGDISAFLTKHIPNGATSRILKPACVSISLTVSAQLMSLPVLMLVFRGLPVWAPLSGILLIPLAEILLYTSLLTSIFGIIPVMKPVAALFAFCAGWLARLLIKIAELLAKLPMGFLDLSKPIWLFALGGSFLLLIFFILFFKDREGVAVVLTGIAALFGAALFMDTAERGVTFAVSADSTAVVAVKDKEAAVFLLDGYRTGAANELLRRENIGHIDSLILMSNGRDAKETAQKLLASRRVDKVFLSDEARLDRYPDVSTEVIRLADGETLYILGDYRAKAGDGLSEIDFSVCGQNVRIGLGDGDEKTALAFGGGGSGIELVINTEDRENLNPGNYIFPGEGGIVVEIYRDGSYGIRGETVGGNE